MYCSDRSDVADRTLTTEGIQVNEGPVEMTFCKSDVKLVGFA